MSAKETPSRQYSLDVLKIAATLCIVFHHYQQTTGARFQGINFWEGSFYFGWVVELFFVLSGYFMYGYIEKIRQGLTLKRFFLDKFLRFFPLMAIAAVAYEVFGYIFYVLYGTWIDHPLNLWGTVITALGLQEGWGFTNPNINNPTWYISVLLLCYLIFYFTVYLSKRLQVPVVYFHLFMIFLGIGVLMYGINAPFLTSPVARGYYAFFTGVILAGQLEKRQERKALEIGSLLIVVGIPILIWKQNYIVSDSPNYIMTFIYYPALIILFLSKPLAMIFRQKWLGVLGKITFDVYIWHSPLFTVLFILIKLFDWNLDLNQVSTMLAFAGVCFLVGTMSYYLIERPLGTIVKRKTNNI